MVDYYAVSAAQHMIYHAWMAAVYPIGWLISYALIAMVFYLVITSVGPVIQLCGRDPLQRKLGRSAKTYWTPHNTREDTQRYFRQFR
jgi:hypothetical protein